MKRFTRRIVGSLAGIGLAAAMIVGLAGPAAAAPTTYTETSLNLGLRLTVSSSNTVIAADPVTGDVGQRWQEPQRVVVVNGVSKIGYELRPAGNTGKCITDVGANQRVQLQTCNNATTQVWEWIHRRTVDGLRYQFWINAQTGRKLMFDTFTSDGPFPSLTVIASNTTFNANTAGEACQLWTD